MKRLFRSATAWRLTALTVVVALSALASKPPAALGVASQPTVAVIQFVNGANAPQGTVTALSDALYQAVGSSGRFTAVGGGPLKVNAAINGDDMTAGLEAGAKAGASEILLGEVIQANRSSVTYRLSAYRVDPLAFIRSQVFSQSNSSTAALVSGFVTNLSTLHAPRTAIGTIYSVTDGVHADLGTSTGFALGQRFNVMRNGTKVAEAQIASIQLNDASMTLSNAASGYSPAIGDQLVGTEPLPAIADAPSNHVNTFNPLALLVVAGAALLAIGHHGQAAAILPQPSPTFTVPPTFSVSGHEVGAPPNPTFVFTFSQPVDTSMIDFTSTTYMSYTTTNPITPVSPVTNLQGPPPAFDSSNTVLTVSSSGVLVPGETITFTFTSAIHDVNGDPLVPAQIPFGPLSTASRPAKRAGAPRGGAPKPQPVTPQAPRPPKPQGPQDPHGPHVPR